MKIPKSYEVLEQRRIADLNSDSLLLRHIRTGARIAVLTNDDENKVFYIGFRTPPADSTGVAHIIEHTVLCGSRDFPVKDPFIELAKGSLNTFLNAMTYPDKTVYPVASCNDTDFRNLMHVYLDAVFYPNIYKEKKIFEQEGWHYEMESADDELKINGVVYNEMKGAFSSPDEVLDRQVLNSLYPETTYAIESGGDPEVIPELTYEAYLDFHRRYYHPSNSYIYLYGNMDVEERLTFLDEAYLSHFDALSVDSEVPLQKPFDRAREVEKYYPILPEDDEKNKTYLTWNTSIGTTLDPKLTIAFDVLDYALCSSSGAVVKKALIDAGIGQEISSNYDSGIRQPLFSICAKNADPEQKEEFCRIIEETIAQQVKNGFDKKALLAAINNDEFKYREADFGRYPKGLLYGLQILDSWLYDDSKPWIHIESGEIYKELKKEAQGSYFEELAQKWLLDNPHRTILMLRPKKGLTEEKDEALREKLAAYKETLSDDQIKGIVDETKALADYQEEPDAPEDLAKIPLLKREDMKKEAEQLINAPFTVAGVKALRHDVFTNGIVYLDLVFDAKKIPDALWPYLGMLRSLLVMMDTEHYSYGDLANEINIRTGGIGTTLNACSMEDGGVLRIFEVNAKMLTENLADAFSLIREVLLTTKFSDPARLKEIFEELRARGQAQLAASGSSTASMRALSAISETSALSEELVGVDALRLVEKLCEEVRDGKRAAELARVFTILTKAIFRKENLFFDVTATKGEAEDVIRTEVEKLTDALFSEPYEALLAEAQELVRGHEVKGDPAYRGKEAFTTPGQVQYVAVAGNFKKHGFAFTGALRALRVMMGYDYLWQNIRVKGGAYGCMGNYRRNGDAFFVTYRDPHLKRSLDVFREAAAYIRGFDADERALTQYIIGAVSELDTPKTPMAKGAASMIAYLTGITQEMIQQARDELLAVTGDDIRALADIVEAFVSDGQICVVGSAEKIKAHEDLFARIEPLSR
ncbi:MAG: insulinase family protein [Lachnospiraceae bacterium]|nr:insulinase family protein [Lachnospiraceae bacterium]